MESKIKLIDTRIKQLESLVTAGVDESNLLKQLRSLRDDVKSKANISYYEYIERIKNSFKSLAELLNDLDYYSMESCKFNTNIPKIISNLKIVENDFCRVTNEKEDDKKVDEQHI